jgi:hypothetical protein
MVVDPGVNEFARDESSAYLQGSDAPTLNGTQPGAPRVIHHDGVAYVEGCDVAIWRLEMNRRAGSPSSAQLKVAPGLTPEGLELAFAYADQHPEEMDEPIRELGLDDVPLEEEEDDEDEFRADMEEMFERDAELFRHLAD